MPISGSRRSMSRRPVRTALARLPPTRDTGRAAARRAGSFNSYSTFTSKIKRPWQKNGNWVVWLNHCDFHGRNAI